MEPSKEKKKSILVAHTSFVIAIAITTDNKRIVSGSHDKTIIVWNLQQKKVKAVLKGHND